MPKVVQDDIRALNMLATGGQSEDIRDKFKAKLGVDDDDIMAWKVSQTHKDAETKDALQTKVLDKIQTQKPSFDRFKAIVKSGAQGVSFAFSDEIIAGAKAGFESIAKGKDFKPLFDKKVKAERAELKRLEEKYPLETIAAELVGAFIVPIPGTTALKTASMAPRVLGKGVQLATEAALFSAGKTEAEVGSKQFIKEVAQGTGVGVAGGALLGTAGKAAGTLIKKGEKPIKKAAQIVSNVFFDLPPAYTAKLLNRRTANKILNPKSSNDIVDSIIDITKSMGDHAKALSIKATDKLSAKKDIKLKSILKEIAKLPTTQRAYKSTMSESRKAKKAVQDVIEDLTLRAGKSGKLSGKELKRFVQDVDLEIPWNTLDWKTSDKALSEIRSHISNSILKKNKDYAEAMLPIEGIMKNLKDISKSFSLKRDGYKTRASDTTFSKVKNFFDVSGASKKPVTEEALKKAEGSFFGPGKPSILEDIEVGQIARRTEGGQPAGSRNILQGLIAGTAFGLPVWGAIAGAIKDKYGRRVGKSILPKTIGAIEKTDALTKKAVQSIDPVLLDRGLTTVGRVEGVQLGVEGAQKPSLLP